MDTALLFEHLICDNIGSSYKSIGSSIYNACASEQNTYKNGFCVGRVYELTRIAITKIAVKMVDDKKKEIVSKVINRLNNASSFNEIDEIIRELNENSILF